VVELAGESRNVLRATQPPPPYRDHLSTFQRFLQRLQVIVQLLIHLASDHAFRQFEETARLGVEERGDQRGSSVYQEFRPACQRKRGLGCLPFISGGRIPDRHFAARFHRLTESFLRPRIGCANTRLSCGGDFRFEDASLPGGGLAEIRYQGKGMFRRAIDLDGFFHVCHEIFSFFV